MKSRVNKFINEFLNSDKIDCDAAIITSRTNRRYFSKFDSSFGVMFIAKQKAYLLVDFRYYEAAKNKALDCEVLMFERLNESIKNLILKDNIKSVMFENDKFTLKEMNLFKNILKGLNVQTVFDSTLDRLIEKMRTIKTEDEIENISLAQKITDEAFLHALSVIKEGVTEKELAISLEFFMRKNGAEAVAFETICVSGKNSSLPHGVPSNKPFKAGDFITIDMGAVVNGYHSDMTRTVILGEATQEQKNVYNTVLNAQLKGISKIRPKVVCGDVDKEVREYIYNSGYKGCFGHSTGHGLGLEIHENPVVSPKGNTILEPGMVLTVEPGIYIKNKFGVRIEDMIVVTKTGCKNLTKATKELIIL